MFIDLEESIDGFEVFVEETIKKEKSLNHVKINFGELLNLNFVVKRESDFLQEKELLEVFSE